MVPCVVMALLHYLKTGDDSSRRVALVLFGIAALSDGIDGWVARRFNQTTKLGALLDPIGDKALTITTFVILSLAQPPQFHPIPLWCVTMFLCRETIIIVGMSLVYYLHHHATIRPRAAAKITTFFQMGLLFWTLSLGNQQVQQILAIITTALTFISAIQYYSDGMKQINRDSESND